MQDLPTLFAYIVQPTPASPDPDETLRWTSERAAPAQREDR